ncbi:hypothetical protein BGX24_005345, partial [Mortierella sp. AD032]
LIMSEPTKYIKWVMDPSPNHKEHVTFGSFVRHFDLTNKESASRSYESLIQSQEISTKEAAVTSQKVGVKQSIIAFEGHFSAAGGLSKRPIADLQEEGRPVVQSARKNEGGSFDNDSARIKRKTTSNGNETEDDLAEVAENTPFAHLVMRLYRKFGHSLPSIQPRVLFPTTASRQLYEFAEGILNKWDTSSKIKRKDCISRPEALLFHISRHCITVEAGRSLQCHGTAVALFEGLDKILGYGEQQSINRLRRHCSRRRDDLEQDKEQDLGWTGEQADAKREELKIMHVLEFLCDEILALQKIANTSEHEDVFIWRGVARILHSHEVVIRFGELGSSSTREDRRDIEEQFDGTESGVRSRKIDILYQLCPRGAKSPIEIVAWEAKPDAASAETLQVQLRKKIRTNASMMNKLAPYLDSGLPRPAPIVVDIIGSRALAYIVHKIEPGVFGAGAISEGVVE